MIPWLHVKQVSAAVQTPLNTRTDAWFDIGYRDGRLGLLERAPRPFDERVAYRAGFDAGTSARRQLEDLRFSNEEAPDTESGTALTAAPQATVSGRRGDKAASVSSADRVMRAPVTPIP